MEAAGLWWTPGLQTPDAHWSGCLCCPPQADPPLLPSHWCTGSAPQHLPQGHQGLLSISPVTSPRASKVCALVHSCESTLSSESGTYTRGTFQSGGTQRAKGLGRKGRPQHAQPRAICPKRSPCPMLSPLFTCHHLPSDGL